MLTLMFFRFLQKGFSYAYTYTKPDIVIFLGDLMDEGSKALGQEYMETLHRFHSVFDIASHIKVRFCFKMFGLTLPIRKF